MKVKVHNDQSVMNFALQHYGSIAGMAQMIADGVIDGFDSELTPGTKVSIGTPINARVATWYTDNAVAVATGGIVTSSSGSGFSDGYSPGYGGTDGAYSDGFDEGFE